MKVEKLNTYDPTAEGSVWQSLCGPCDNCGHLIKGAGGDPTKFSRNRDKRYAPTTPTSSQMTTSMDEPTTGPVATAATEAPNGWSNKPEDMNTNYYWGANGEGTDVSIQVPEVTLQPFGSWLPGTSNIVLVYSSIIAATNSRRLSGREEGGFDQPGRASDR